MADTKISALTSGGAIAATDVIPVVRSGANKRVTLGSALAEIGDSDIRNWCVADGSTDDSAAFATALTDRAGAPLFIPAGVSVRLDTLVTHTGAVDLRLDGTISHSRNGGLYVKNSLTSLGAISAFATVESPTGFDPASVTKITLSSVPGSVIRGKVLLITSGDQYPEAAGMYLGELAKVESVSGNDVVLSQLLEWTYSTSPVCHLLSDNAVTVVGAGKFTNPNYLTEDTGATGSALKIETSFQPRVVCNFENQANAAVIAHSCWRPTVDIKVTNQRNNQTDSSYGYGALGVAATAYGEFKINSTGSRHVFDVNGYVSTSVENKGAPKYNVCRDSYSFAALSAGFSTHEAAYYTRFENCVVEKHTGNQDYTSESTQYAFVDRGAGTSFVNCAAYGVSGVHLEGAAANRTGAARKYTTRVIDFTADPDKDSGYTGLRVAAGYNATVAGYHEVEIVGGEIRNTRVTVGNAAPRVLFKDINFREQSASFVLGSSNTIVLRNVARRRESGALPNITVGPGTTVYVESYTAEAASYSNNTLIYATGGAGTATVKLGSLYAPQALPTTWASSDGTTTLASSQISNITAGVSASVDNEIALFSGTAGNALKRATTTGLLKGTSGVISAATADTDYVTPARSKMLAADTWANRPAAASYTEYIFPCTDLGTGGFALFYSDGTDWRPVGGRLILVANTGTIASPLGSISAATSGQFITCTIPAGLIPPNARLYSQAFIQRTGANGTASYRARLGTAGTSSDSIICSIAVAATDALQTSLGTFASFGTSTTAFFTSDYLNLVASSASSVFTERTTNVNTDAAMTLGYYMDTGNASDSFKLISWMVELIA